MAGIEINTAQNVRIEYELAGTAQRVFAYLTDLIIMVLVFVFFVAGYSRYLTDGDPQLISLILQTFGFFWFGFYTLLSELFGDGQSIGKLAMGIRVIKLNGEEPGFYDYFSRWSMRLIDIYMSMGGIALFLTAANRNGQRLGDIVAGTCVIRKRSAYRFSLGDILDLNRKTKEGHTFQYPLASRLEEKDVILIKNLLSRYGRFANRAHREALGMMCEKVAQILEIRQVPAEQEVFLKRVVAEYILLTR